MSDPDSNTPKPQRITIQLPRPLWIFVVTVVLVGIGLWDGFPSCVQLVHAKYAHGVEFIGIRRTEGDPTTFFSIRIRSRNGVTMDTECPVVVTWAGNNLKVGDLTAESAAAAGIVLKSPDYKPPGHLHGFIGGDDDQNRDYHIELEFYEGKLIEMFAWHNRKSAVPCPFLVSFDEKRAIAFPVSEAKLTEAFGEPEAVFAECTK